jgi:hypothetical protein
MPGTQLLKQYFVHRSLYRIQKSGSCDGEGRVRSASTSLAIWSINLRSAQHKDAITAAEINVRAICFCNTYLFEMSLHSSVACPMSARKIHSIQLLPNITTDKLIEGSSANFHKICIFISPETHRYVAVTVTGDR